MMDAKTEPMAMVDAKSKLDIFANVRNPKTLVKIIMMEKIPNTEEINHKDSVSVISKF